MLALVLPEDHAVDVAELGLERVDDVVLVLDGALDLASQLDQPWKLTRLDPLLDRGVEGTAERNVHASLADPEALAPHVRGNVAEADRAHAAVLDPRPGLEASGRHVDDDAGLALAALDDALVERPGDERDRPVPAGGRVARVVEEHDAEVRAPIVRLDDEAAVHVRVPARLEDEQAPDVVEACECIAPLVENRRAPERLDAAGDDPERLAARVVVDRRDAAHAVALP